MPNPASPDTGVYVDESTEAAQKLHTNGTSELAQHKLILSDGTILVAWVEKTNNDDISFSYSTDHGSTWTTCTSKWTPYDTVATSSFALAVDDNDNIFGFAYTAVGRYAAHITFSGSDITVVTSSSIGGGPQAAMNLVLTDDPGTGSSYDMILVAAGGTGTVAWATVGWLSSGSLTLLSSGTASTAADYSAACPMGSAATPQYQGSTTDVYLVGRHPTYDYVATKIYWSSGTTWTTTQSANSSVTGLASGMYFHRGWYDGTYLYAMCFDTSAGDFNVIYQTPASFNTTWTLATAEVDDATYAAAAGKVQGEYYAILDKVFVTYWYDTTPNDKILYQWYDVGTDTWDGSWSTFDVSANVNSILSGVSETTSYSEPSIAVNMLDDSSAIWVVYQSFYTASAQPGWGMITLG